MYSPGRQGPNMLLKKRLSQSKNNAQLWMCLVTEVKSNAVKNNIA